MYEYEVIEEQRRKERYRLCVINMLESARVWHILLAVVGLSGCGWALFNIIKDLYL